MQHILKLDKDDPQKELEFEVMCALEKDPNERLDYWLKWNIKMLKWVEEMHGHQDSPKVVKLT